MSNSPSNPEETWESNNEKYIWYQSKTEETPSIFSSSLPTNEIEVTYELITPNEKPS